MSAGFVSVQTPPASCACWVFEIATAPLPDCTRSWRGTGRLWPPYASAETRKRSCRRRCRIRRRARRPSSLCRARACSAWAELWRSWTDRGSASRSCRKWSCSWPSGSRCWPPSLGCRCSLLCPFLFWLQIGKGLTTATVRLGMCRSHQSSANNIAKKRRIKNFLNRLGSRWVKRNQKVRCFLFVGEIEQNIYWGESRKN